MKYILYQQPYYSINRISNLVLVVFIILSAAHCTPKKSKKEHAQIVEISLTPTPAKLLYKRNYFTLEKSLRVLLNLSDNKSKEASEVLIQQLKVKTGRKFKIADRYRTEKIKNTIEIITDNKEVDIRSQGFRIKITPNKIKLYAKDKLGLHYGVQAIIDLLQLKNKKWQIPQATITDYPKIANRAIYLSVADSLWPSNLQEILIKNRITQLITPWKPNLIKNDYLIITDTSNLITNWEQHVLEISSVKQFYYKPPSNNENTVILGIKNQHMLHPDSLAILGEALWSPNKRLNFSDIANRLQPKRLN